MLKKFFCGCMCACVAGAGGETLTWNGTDGGTIRYEVERDSRSGAVAVAGDTSLAATGKVDVVSSLAAGKVPSRNALVVTQGETTGPASYDGWTTTLNGGRFPATLEVDNGTFLLRNDVGLVIILR